MSVKPLSEENRVDTIRLVNAESGTDSSNHAVYFCWPFHHVDKEWKALENALQRETLRQLLHAKGHQIDAISPEHLTKSIWQAGAPVGNDDISLRIKQLLHADSDADKNPFLPCRLTPDALTVLGAGFPYQAHSSPALSSEKKRKYQFSFGLCIKSKSLPAQLFPDVNEEELKQGQCIIGFNLQEVFLYATQMRVGTLVTKVNYTDVLLVNGGIAIKQRPVNANDIQHANYYLYRNGHQEPVLCKTIRVPVPNAPQSSKDTRLQNIQDDLKQFDIAISTEHLKQNAGANLYCCYDFSASSLLRIIQPCLGTRLGNKIAFDHQRTFTLSYLTLAEKSLTSKVHKLGYQIAKKESYRYPATQDVIDTSLLNDHEDIVHYLTLSGGCMMVLPHTHQHSNPAFLDNYITKQGEKIYLPIFVLALLEQHYLKRLDIQGSIEVHSNNFRQIRVQIEGQLQQLIDFRLNYRFSTISAIHNHNVVYERWREVFLLDKRLDERTKDVKECFELVKCKQDSLTTKKIRRLESFGAIVAACIFLFGFFGMNIQEVSNIELFSWDFKWPQWMSLIVIAAAVAYIIWLNKINND